MGLKLIDAWCQRHKLYAKGRKLSDEGSELLSHSEELIIRANRPGAQKDKLLSEARLLGARANKLFLEANKPDTEGDKLWIDAITAAYGSTDYDLRWRKDKQDFDCALPNGDIYTVEMAEEQMKVKETSE